MAGKITLKNFHFDPKKAAITINRWQAEANVGTNYIVDETGITIDRIKNNKRGEVQDPKIELVFKLSIALGKGLHGVTEYIMDQFADVDIDFADQLHINEGVVTMAQKYVESLPLAEPAKPSSAENTSGQSFDLYAQHMHAEHSEVFDRVNNIYALHVSQLGAQVEQLKESRTLMREQFQAQLEKMEAQHRAHIDALQTAHDRERQVDEDHFQKERSGWMSTIRHKEEEVARLRKNNVRCVLGICVSAFLLFLALLVLLLR